MIAKDYCSKVCGAKCCKAHAPLLAPDRCPMLTKDNLCARYATRLGFTFPGRTIDGRSVTCVCQRSEVFLPTLPPEVLAQCCIAHPELLNQ